MSYSKYDEYKNAFDTADIFHYSTRTFQYNYYY
jgi:hypothetical protein